MESLSSNTNEKQIYGQLKAFFGKQNSQSQVTEVIRLPNESQRVAVPIKCNRKSRTRVHAQDSPFAKKSIQHSPQLRQSPNFASVTESNSQAPSHFYIRLKSIIETDRRILTMKNILSSWSRQTNQTRGQVLQELTELLGRQQMMVSLEEYDADAELGSCILLKSSQFLAQYSKAEKEHSNLLNQISVEEAGMVFQDIDYHSKGHVDLYDLTREVSANTGTCYKPRDLYLFYRRLTKGRKNWLSRQDWMEAWSDRALKINN